MNIYAATGNLHKKQELQQLFAPHTVSIPKDQGIAFDPEENGSSFVENSLIKAKALYDIVQKPVIADDSGICVDVLDGRPGIYSARYQGKRVPVSDEKISDEQRNLKLLEEAWEAADAAGISRDQITARFVCAMVLYLGPDRFYCIQETIEGRLVESLDKISGDGGFGYDPVLYLPEYGKTIADLTSDEKNAISHRGKAAKKIAGLL